MAALARISSGFSNKAICRSHASHIRNSIRRMSVKKHEDIGVCGYSLLIIPATTFALGCWQIKRRTWKLDLIKSLQEGAKSQPVPLPHDFNEIDQLEFKKVFVQGYFDHSKEMYIVQRSLIPQDGEEPRGTIMSDPTRVGANVITPFFLMDRNASILVNRGWVPRRKMNPASRKEGQIEGEIQFVGVVRKTEKRQPFGIKNDPSSNKFFHRDIDLMAQVANTSPVLIDATYDSTIPGGPIGGQTRITLRNEHFSYIVTWFSLTIGTAYLWYRKLYQRKPIL